MDHLGHVPGHLPLDHEDPTPAAVIAAAQAAAPTATQHDDRRPVDVPRQFEPSHPASTLPYDSTDSTAWLPVSGMPESGPYPPQWLTPGSPYPGSPPAAYPAAPVRRRRGRVVALIAGALALLCAVPLTLAAVALPWLLRREGSAQPPDSVAPTAARSPQPGDPLPVSQAWVRERVIAALAQQRAALVAGDEVGYLKIVAGSADAGPARAVLLKQFRSLRAMKVAAWRDDVDRFPSKAQGGRWTVTVSGYACFVTAPCADAAAEASTVWQITGDQAAVVGWEPSSTGSSPHPWQVSALLSRSGARTVVATTKAYAGVLPMLLREAEKAAAVADRFARPGKAPTRYVVYYAGPKEWKQWFGWTPPEWSGGVAIDVSVDRYELVLNAADLHPSFLDDILRHELTHAASLPGRYRDSDDLWWLIEGIAEVAEMEGTPVSKYPSLDDVVRYVKTWKRDIRVDPPTAGTADWQVGARYGVGFLAVRHLAARFGEAKLVEFFHAVVHDSQELSVAAEAVFGVSWSVVNAECADYVEQARH